jgi:hypothetical protein
VSSWCVNAEKTRRPSLFLVLRGCEILVMLQAESSIIMICKHMVVEVKERKEHEKNEN